MWTLTDPGRGGREPDAGPKGSLLEAAARPTTRSAAGTGRQTAPAARARLGGSRGPGGVDKSERARGGCLGVIRRGGRGKPREAPGGGSKKIQPPGTPQSPGA